jgi:allantoicase
MNNPAGENRPSFTSLTDLISERLGAKVLYATDDFFAEKENLIKASEPIFIADKYTDKGKWMDGWESRRKRDPGNDYCIIQMGVTGVITGFDVDTRHFRGNAPLEISIEGIMLDQFKLSLKSIDKKINWIDIIPLTKVDANSHNYIKNKNLDIFSHIKLQIYPDGGVARLRAYGTVYKNWLTEDITGQFDLAAALNGG